MQPRELLIKNLIEVINRENDEKLEINKFELKFEISKYSTKKTPIYHVYYENKRITKKDNLYITYKCINCEITNKISTTQFLRKIIRNKTNCYNCVNKDYEKRINNMLNQNKEIKILSINEKAKHAEEYFNDLDEKDKIAYYNKHMTNNEYERIKKNLISLGNGKYNKDIIQRLIYYPFFPAQNQNIITSILYDPINNELINTYQPILKCDNCSNEWRAKSLEGQKNYIKIMCMDCKRCNLVFKRRITENILKEKIIYQSKLELKFINYCNNNLFVIRNGQKLKYLYNNKEHIYNVDFEISYNNIKILVEINDNNRWYKLQVKNGIWNLKMESVKNFLDNNKEYLKFVLINPHNWLREIKNLFI